MTGRYGCPDCVEVQSREGAITTTCTRRAYCHIVAETAPPTAYAQLETGKHRERRKEMDERPARIREAQLAVLAAARKYRASLLPDSLDSPMDTGFELDDAIFAMTDAEAEDKPT